MMCDLMSERLKNGRGERTRTSDPQHPMLVRYQTAPHPDRHILPIPRPANGR